MKGAKKTNRGIERRGLMCTKDHYGVTKRISCEFYIAFVGDFKLYFLTLSILFRVEFDGMFNHDGR